MVNLTDFAVLVAILASMNKVLKVESIQIPNSSSAVFMTRRHFLKDSPQPAVSLKVCSQSKTQCPGEDP